MNNQDYINYAIIGGGAIITLFSAYQIYKKGFLLWLILIIIGVTAINYGVSSKGDLTIDNFLEQLNPGKLSKFSKEKLNEICNKVSSIPTYKQE